MGLWQNFLRKRKEERSMEDTAKGRKEKSLET